MYKRQALGRAQTLRLQSNQVNVISHPQGGGFGGQGGPRGPDIAALAWSAGSDGNIYRELDAAGRAALAGDGAPLLRLAARTGLNGSLADGWAADLYSVGHAVGVPCTDYPQPFDMGASSAVRAEQYNAAVAALPGDAFAPFSNRQWLNNPIQDYYLRRVEGGKNKAIGVAIKAYEDPATGCKL